MILLMLNVSCSSSQLQQRDVAAIQPHSSEQQPQSSQEKWDEYLAKKHKQHLE